MLKKTILKEEMIPFMEVIETVLHVGPFKSVLTDEEYQEIAERYFKGSIIIFHNPPTWILKHFELIQVGKTFIYVK